MKNFTKTQQAGLYSAGIGAGVMAIIMLTNSLDVAQILASTTLVLFGIILLIFGKSSKAILMSVLLLAFILLVAGFYLLNNHIYNEKQPSEPVTGEELSKDQEQKLISDYIKQNISTLSPEPEVLGGTFYVTNIEFSAGTNFGTVEYEDGHIALVADFEYSFNEDGDPEIKSFTLRSDSQNNRELSTLPNIETIIPEGWYKHEMNSNSVLLTRSQTLPEVGDTEMYAYGEQISASVTPFDGDPTHPEKWQQLAWLEDEARVDERGWTSVADFTALRVRHEAGGASGDQLTLYLFGDNFVHILYLYPANDSSHLETFNRFVYRYGALLSSPGAENTYKNDTYGFSFNYPTHWHPDPNNSADLFQFRNYDSSQVVGGHSWGENQNKIEGVIVPDDTYDSSSNFPEKSRQASQVTVDGRDAMRYDIVLEAGTHIRSYVIPLQNETDEYLIITIYGDDAKNFSALEQVIDTLTFL